MGIRYSVVIPVYNEKDSLARCVGYVRRLNPDCQIIVSDGGSSDPSAQIAIDAGAFVCCGRLGRGIQLNRGAQEAKADVLIFLHVDTILPKDAFIMLDKYFLNPQVKIATFRLRFDSRHWVLRLCGYFTRFDSVFTRFGDQCICVRSDFFRELGGFPEWPLFEDIHFLRLARRRTRLYSLPSEVVTSARKFQKNGIIRQQFRNGMLIVKYLLGVPAQTLAKEYA